MKTLTIKTVKDGKHDPSFEVRDRGITLATFHSREGAQAYVRMMVRASWTGGPK